MSNNPLSQFEVKNIIPLQIANIDFSFTNSALFMSLSLLLFSVFFVQATKRQLIIPNRLQALAESLFEICYSMVDKNIGAQGRKYVPLIFSFFIFIMFCNLLGMLPYSFTSTSQLVVTFALAIIVFFVVLIVGFLKHGLHFLSLFLPSGTPLWLAPLMIVIELFTFLARPISLSLRLCANMIAGHVLLKVMAGFIISLSLYFKWLPVPLIIMLIGFEIFVAILQAYIFSILTCVYLNDAVNLH